MLETAIVAAIRIESALMSECDHVLDSFQLQKLEHNLFQSRSPSVGWRRIYGGLLLSHAVLAAEQDKPETMQLHSLHGNFLRPGNTEQPLLLRVEPLLTGRTIAHRHVRIEQHGKTVFLANISFRNTAGGLSFRPAMPAAPAPQELADEQEIAKEFAGRLPGNAETYLKRNKAFELRPVNPQDLLFGPGSAASPILTWARLNTAQPPRQEHDTALLAYLSDMLVLNASLAPHGRSFFDSDLTMASLDHALWQHDQPDWSEWVLIEQESLASDAQMGLGHTRIYNRSGSLCATVTQQGFTRLNYA
jgi:acyl-CoA thioesterase-2